MPFNDDLYTQPATRGDLAGIAINVEVALWAILQALRRIKAGEDFSEHVKDIENCAERIDKSFNELTGWTPKE